MKFLVTIGNICGTFDISENWKNISTQDAVDEIQVIINSDNSQLVLLDLNLENKIIIPNKMLMDNIIYVKQYIKEN